MHPLRCVKYGAAALALGPAHHGAARRRERSNPLMCKCAAIMCNFFEFFLLRPVSFTLFSHIYAFQSLCVCLRVYCYYLFCSVYTCAPCRASRMKHISVLCSCTDLERTASCIASAGHAWAVPVSDMRGALRALYEVTIMPVFIAVYT